MSNELSSRQRTLGCNVAQDRTGPQGSPRTEKSARHDFQRVGFPESLLELAELDGPGQKALEIQCSEVPVLPLVYSMELHLVAPLSNKRSCVIALCR